MAGLADNILNLARLRRQRETAIANLAEPLRLTLVAPSGENPGALRMLTYVPPGLSPGAPLVVVLHGCTQNAAAYDAGSGWSQLAERHGFAVLFPEQQRANNPNLCFNWFNPDDTTRGHGEAESIRAMTRQVIDAHAIDRNRVFVTGLSAGAAMTAAMLATSPDLFAAGAIIAGLPYKAATSVPEAFAAMNQVRRNPARTWGDLVRAASPHTGPRPAVQIWQGTADTTVNPGNAAELVAQWTDVLGLPPTPTTAETIDGATHETWPGPDGRPRLERWTIPGLAHGTPVGPAGMQDAPGTPGPHMLASTISATGHLARSWGLLTQAAITAPRPAPPRPAAARPPLLAALPGASVIEKALRTAGLMK